MKWAVLIPWLDTNESIYSLQMNSFFLLKFNHHSAVGLFKGIGTLLVSIDQMLDRLVIETGNTLVKLMSII
jgi:hypothetical protein